MTTTNSATFHGHGGGRIGGGFPRGGGWPRARGGGWRPRGGWFPRGGYGGGYGGYGNSCYGCCPFGGGFWTGVKGVFSAKKAPQPVPSAPALHAQPVIKRS